MRLVGLADSGIRDDESRPTASASQRPSSGSSTSVTPRPGATPVNPPKHQHSTVCPPGTATFTWFQSPASFERNPAKRPAASPKMSCATKYVGPGYVTTPPRNEVASQSVLFS